MDQEFVLARAVVEGFLTELRFLKESAPSPRILSYVPVSGEYLSSIYRFCVSQALIIRTLRQRNLYLAVFWRIVKEIEHARLIYMP
jgi:hypothetical protein